MAIPKSALQRADGAIEIRLGCASSGHARLVHLFQAAPCRALFPDIERHEPHQTVLVNTAGGLVGGDHLATRIHVEASAAVVTTQAAEKLYGSTGEIATIQTHLSLIDGAILEWLPQYAVFFDGCRLRRQIHADISADALLIATECVVFGRRARNEHVTCGFLHDEWRIRIDGHLRWADTLRITEDQWATRHRPFTFGGSAGYATLVCAGDRASSLLPALQEIAASLPSTVAATLVNGIVLLRLLDEDSDRLVRSLGTAIAAFRHAALGHDAKLPTAWTL